jgi:hypothetical protein
MRNIKHELQHILQRMVAISERFPVQSSQEPFRDIADAVATLAEILLSEHYDGEDWIQDE